MADQDTLDVPLSQQEDFTPEKRPDLSKFKGTRDPQSTKLYKDSLAPDRNVGKLDNFKGNTQANRQRQTISDAINAIPKEALFAQTPQFRKTFIQGMTTGEDKLTKSEVKMLDQAASQGIIPDDWRFKSFETIQQTTEEKSVTQRSVQKQMRLVADLGLMIMVEAGNKALKKAGELGGDVVEGVKKIPKETGKDIVKATGVKAGDIPPLPGSTESKLKTGMSILRVIAAGTEALLEEIGFDGDSGKRNEKDFINFIDPVDQKRFMEADISEKLRLLIETGGGYVDQAFRQVLEFPSKGTLDVIEGGKPDGPETAGEAGARISKNALGILKPMTNLVTLVGLNSAAPVGSPAFNEALYELFDDPITHGLYLMGGVGRATKSLRRAQTGLAAKGVESVVKPPEVKGDVAQTQKLGEGAVDAGRLPDAKIVDGKVVPIEKPKAPEIKTETPKAELEIPEKQVTPKPVLKEAPKNIIQQNIEAQSAVAHQKAKIEVTEQAIKIAKEKGITDKVNQFEADLVKERADLAEFESTFETLKAERKSQVKQLDKEVPDLTDLHQFRQFKETVKEHMGIPQSLEFPPELQKAFDLLEGGKGKKAPAVNFNGFLVPTTKGIEGVVKALETEGLELKDGKVVEIKKPKALEVKVETAKAGPAKFDKFVERAIKREAREEAGKDILFKMEEEGVSPAENNRKFWDESYDKLDAKGKEKVQRSIKSIFGFELKSVVATKGGKDIYAKDWKDLGKNYLDLPDEIRHLEGTERGFVVAQATALEKGITDKVNQFEAELVKERADLAELESTFETTKPMVLKKGGQTGTKGRADTGFIEKLVEDQRAIIRDAEQLIAKNKKAGFTKETLAKLTQEQKQKIAGAKDELILLDAGIKEIVKALETEGLELVDGKVVELKAVAPSEVKTETAKPEKGIGGAIVKGIEKAQEIASRITPEAIKQAGKRVYTPQGKKIVSMIARADEVKAGLTGKWLEDARTAGLRKIKSEKEGIARTESIELAQGSKGSAYRELFNKIRKEAARHGIKISYRKGYVPSRVKTKISERISDDLVHLLNQLEKVQKRNPEREISNEVVQSALIKKSKFLQTAVNSLIENGVRDSKGKMTEVKNLKEALNILNSNKTQNWLRKSRAEHSRVLELPADFYERDIRQLLPQYIDEIASRIATVKTFGLKGEKWNKVHNELLKSDFAEAEITQTLLDIWTGEHERTNRWKGNLRWMNTVSSAFMGFESATKIGLGTATIPNVTQALISTIPSAGGYNSLVGGIKLFTKARRKEIRLSGSLKHSALLTFGGIEPTGVMGKVANRLTKLSGFQAINRFNQYLSASTFMEASAHWHKLANRPGIRQKWAREKLAQFNIDYKKQISTESLENGMYRFATDEQLQHNILKDPLIFNNPKFRPLALFKRFGYKQFIKSKDMITWEIKRGNVMPAIRLMLGGAVGGEGVVFAKNKIKQWLTGEPVYREEDWTDWERYVNDLAAVGAAGTVGDLAAIDDIIQGFGAVEFAATPVIVSDIYKIGAAFVAASKDIKTRGFESGLRRKGPDVITDVAGSIPRWIRKRFLTEGQERQRDSFYKGRKRSEVMDLILKGDKDEAGRLWELWNKNNPDQPIEINSDDILERVNMKIRLGHKLEILEKSTNSKRLNP